MGEAELVRRAKDGDMAAFEQLISNYQMKIYHIAYHMLSNEQDAEDAAQEAMIKAYRYLGSFKAVFIHGYTVSRTTSVWTCSADASAV